MISKISNYSGILLEIYDVGQGIFIAFDHLQTGGKGVDVAPLEVVVHDQKAEGLDRVLIPPL